MARKATLQAAPEEAPADGLKKAQYVLKIAHIRALRQEAFRRAADRITGGADASEVLREILDAWVAAKGGKR